MIFKKLVSYLSEGLVFKKTIFLQVSADQAKWKWHSLLGTYKKAKDHNKKSGNDPKIPPFFYELEDILEDKPTAKGNDFCFDSSNKVVNVEKNIADTDIPDNETSGVETEQAVECPKADSSKKGNQKNKEV